MAEVDPRDDSIWRWVLQHYRFDPERHERRNVTVAAYDNEADFAAAVEALGELIRAGVDSGDRERAEHVCGVVWPPGHQAEQARGRTVRKAMHHGVDPRRVPLEGPLPSNVSFVGWDEDGTTWSFGGGEPPEPPPSA